MCLNLKQLKHIKKLLAKSKVKITSNLVLRVNDLFVNIKKEIKEKIFFMLRQIIFGGE